MHPIPSSILEMLHKPRTPFHAIKFGNPIPNPPTTAHQPEKKPHIYLPKIAASTAPPGQNSTRICREMFPTLVSKHVPSRPSPPAPRCRWDPGWGGGTGGHNTGGPAPSIAHPEPPIPVERIQQLGDVGVVTTSQDLDLHHIVLQFLLTRGVDHLGGCQHPRHFVLCLGERFCEVSWGTKGAAPKFSDRGKLGPITSLPGCSVLPSQMLGTDVRTPLSPEPGRRGMRGHPMHGADVQVVPAWPCHPVCGSRRIPLYPKTLLQATSSHGCNIVPVGTATASAGTWGLSKPHPKDLYWGSHPASNAKPFACPENTKKREKGMGLARTSPTRARDHHCCVPPAPVPEGGCCCGSGERRIWVSCRAQALHRGFREKHPCLNTLTPSKEANTRRQKGRLQEPVALPLPKVGDGLSQHRVRTLPSSARNLGLFRGFLASCVPETVRCEAAPEKKKKKHLQKPLGHQRRFEVPSYLKDLAEGTIAQLAQHLPGLLGVDIPFNVLVLPRRLLLFRKAKKAPEKSHGATSMQRKGGRLGSSFSTKHLRSLLRSPRSSSPAGRKGLSAAPARAGCAVRWRCRKGDASPHTGRIPPLGIFRMGEKVCAHPKVLPAPPAKATCVGLSIGVPGHPSADIRSFMVAGACLGAHPREFPHACARTSMRSLGWDEQQRALWLG